MPTYALGRRVEHDEQSRSYVARRATEPRSVLWGHHAPVLDQGNLGSCTFSSLAQLINTDPFEASRPNGFLTQQDAIKGYSLATQLDDIPGTYPPEDTGSSGLAAAKAGVQLGYFKTYTHAFGFDAFTATLQIQPVIVGTSWLSGMFNPVNGVVTVAGTVEGGHEYLALGVDYETQILTFLNSWGDSWGASGRFKMTFTDFRYLLSQDGDATAPVIPIPAPTPPTPDPTATGCCAKLRKIRKILAEK